MPTRPLVACLVFCLTGAVAPPGAAASDETENEARLRAMPREHRALLAEKLKQFDALSRAEKDAVRQLDRRIAHLPPTEQATYRAVLRRYHLWVQSLTEAQRAELLNTPPANRMALVTRFRNQEAAGKGAMEAADLLKVIDFGAPSPYETAWLYKIWLQLSPAERAEVQKLPAGAERQNRLAALARQHKLGPESRLPKADVDALIPQIEERFKAKGWALPLAKKAAEKDARAKNNVEARERRRVAENYYFLVNPPQPVEAGRLERFDASLPPWLHPSFDHLPPEEARRRLTAVYRLVYPPPAEMPAPQAATGPGAAPAPKPGAPGGPAPPKPAQAPANPF